MSNQQYASGIRIAPTSSHCYRRENRQWTQSSLFPSSRWMTAVELKALLSSVRMKRIEVCECQEAIPESSTTEWYNRWKLDLQVDECISNDNLLRVPVSGSVYRQTIETDIPRCKPNTTCYCDICVPCDPSASYVTNNCNKVSMRSMSIYKHVLNDWNVIKYPLS